jgi:hypothetical protein
MGHRDHTWIVMVIGWLMLLTGLGAAFLGPLEIYPFYLFSEGGPFYYDGFGFGSFMFGNIAVQVMGYYILAGLLIPLGYGHLRRRRWARTMFVALVYCWLVVGGPLGIVLLFTLFSVKDLGPPAGLAATSVVALSYAVLPWLLLRFYKGRNMRQTFQSADERSYWTERLPMPILVLACLFVFYAVVLHVPIFFNGLFPLFGTWLSGLQGTAALDASILCLAITAWGTFRRSIWAWRTALLYFGFFTASTLLTFVRSSYAEILSVLDFPAFEVDILQGIPLQGVHLAVVVGVPLLLTFALILLSRRSFRPTLEAAADGPEDSE